MAKMTLKIWYQWSPFSIPAESIPGCMFGTNSVILAQICHELSCGRTSQISLNSWVNMAKMTLRVEISYLHFQYIATGLWLLLWYRRCRWNMQWLFILLHIQMSAALQPEQKFWENTLMPLTRIPSYFIYIIYILFYMHKGHKAFVGMCKGSKYVQRFWTIIWLCFK